MSVESAAAFLKTYNSDSGLRDKLQNASDSAERQKVMAEAGFGDVTKDDIETFRSQTGEMSDDQLGQVAGAMGWYEALTDGDPAT